MSNDINCTLNLCSLFNEFKNKQINENKEISRRVDEIVQRLNDLINMPNVVWAKYNKTPYKCPNCDGYGKKELLIGERCVINDCLSCASNGIVWG